MPASRCARCRWTPSRPPAARCAAAWRRSTEPPRQLNAEARKNEKLRPVHRPLSRIIVPPDHHKPKLSGVPPTMIIRLSRLHLFAIVVLVLALAATSAWAQDGRGTGRGQGPQDRKSVVEGQGVSVGGDLGGGRIIKK